MRFSIPEHCYSVQVAAVQVADRARLLEAVSSEVQRRAAVHFSVSDNRMLITLHGQSQTALAHVADTIQSRHGLVVKVGAPFAGYLRAPSESAEADYTHKHLRRGEAEFARLIIRIAPSGNADSRMEIACSRETLPAKYQAGVVAGFQSVLQAEQDHRPPIVGIFIAVVDAAFHHKDSSAHAFEVAARCVLRDALDWSSVLTLEPFMEVTTTTSSQFVGSVIGELSLRRGSIEAVLRNGDSEVMRALVPVANLTGYAERLLSITKGTGYFSLEYCCHAPTPHQQDSGPENFPPAIGMRA